jgi:putative hemolysin
MDTTLSGHRQLKSSRFVAAEQLHSSPDDTDILIIPDVPKGKYQVGYAVSPAAIEQALRLRYMVFNVELGEGLAEAAISGLDRDPFDDQMTHLVLLDGESGEIVGTYRIQAAPYAMKRLGLYSAQEFDMAPLAPYLNETLELGRACLAQDHRAMDALLTLWSGLGHFMNLHNLYYLMGCCSITSTDPDDGWRALKTLRNKNYMHPNLCLSALPEFSCGPMERADDPDLGAPLKLPKLFRIYLLLCAHIISEPAIDREFGTVDYLTFMDGRQVKLSQLDLLK